MWGGGVCGGDGECEDMVVCGEGCVCGGDGECAEGW